MTAQAIQTIAAVYEDGLLRPLEPLNLPEHTHVQLTIAVTENASEISDEELRAIFASVGLQLVEMPTDGLRLLTEEERAALMREIGPGVNASQAIIEERESGW